MSKANYSERQRSMVDRLTYLSKVAGHNPRFKTAEDVSTPTASPMKPDNNAQEPPSMPITAERKDEYTLGNTSPTAEDASKPSENSDPTAAGGRPPENAYASGDAPSDITGTPDRPVDKPEDVTPETSSPMTVKSADELKKMSVAELLAFSERLQGDLTKSAAGAAPSPSIPAAAAPATAPAAADGGYETAAGAVGDTVHPLVREQYILGKQAGLLLYTEVLAPRLRKMAEEGPPAESDSPGATMPPEAGAPGGAPGGEAAGGPPPEGAPHGGGGDEEEMAMAIGQIIEGMGISPEQFAQMPPEEQEKILEQAIQILSSGAGGAGGEAAPAPGGEAGGPPAGDGGGPPIPEDGGSATDSMASAEKTAALSDAEFDALVQNMIDQNLSPDHLEGLGMNLLQKSASAGVGAQEARQLASRSKEAFDLADRGRQRARSGRWAPRAASRNDEALRNKMGIYLLDMQRQAQI